MNKKKQVPFSLSSAIISSTLRSECDDSSEPDNTDDDDDDDDYDDDDDDDDFEITRSTCVTKWMTKRLQLVKNHVFWRIFCLLQIFVNSRSNQFVRPEVHDFGSF